MPVVSRTFGGYYESLDYQTDVYAELGYADSSHTVFTVLGGGGSKAHLPVNITVGATPGLVSTDILWLTSVTYDNGGTDFDQAGALGASAINACTVGVYGFEESWDDSGNGNWSVMVNSRIGGLSYVEAETSQLLAPLVHNQMVNQGVV